MSLSVSERERARESEQNGSWCPFVTLGNDVSSLLSHYIGQKRVTRLNPHSRGEDYTRASNIRKQGSLGAILENVYHSGVFWGFFCYRVLLLLWTNNAFCSECLSPTIFTNMMFQQTLDITCQVFNFLKKSLVIYFFYEGSIYIFSCIISLQIFLYYMRKLSPFLSCMWLIIFSLCRSSFDFVHDVCAK